MRAGVNVYLEVYIDVIFLINLFMDFILLQIVRKILKHSCTKIRIFCGALVGAIGACILAVVPDLNGIIQFLISYIIICFAMISITCHQENRKMKIKAVIVLYITTFFLGGLMNSLYYNSNLGFYFRELVHGKLFTNLGISYYAFIILAVIVVIPIFIEAFLSFRRGNLELYQTELTYGDKNIQIIGLLDTGNSLYDPIYGKPVIIVEYSALIPLLSIDQANILKEMIDSVEGNSDTSKAKTYFPKNSIYNNYGEERLNIMLIPYHSIGKKNGMLPAIFLNRVVVKDGEEQICNEKVLAAVSGSKLSKKSAYQMILHRDIM
jgi:stage II sporulation protein GA (sporulation sigma-E factor processing peptidase)